MFSKILIANRGEIAVRIIRACREMGISTVAVYSQADKNALHVSMADESYCIGGAQVADSYLNMAAILEVAVVSGAQAIHPGYGLLSENAKFVSLCEKCNIEFIGPSSAMIEKLGDKDEARKTMRNAGVPVTPGSDVIDDIDEARQKAAESDLLRNQLNELNSLRQKVEELNRARNQIKQINNLNNEFDQINTLKQQLNELNHMRNKSMEDKALKDRINELENMKTQYEQELNILRASQRKSQELNNKLRYSSGMDSKQLYFEESPLQFAVKGDIIHNSQELELLTRKINKSNRKLTLNLLYKARADSDRAEAFHNKCDEAKSTLVLIETDKGKRFGGYTSRSWGGDCIEKKDDEAFIFSLDKMMTYDIIPGEDAIGCYPKYGPIFMGCQIRIYDNAFVKGGTTFEKGLNYNTQEDFELTGGDREFQVREIEVYEVISS